jgi:RNA polymerase sigma-70 factor (ECF subfamily)
VPAGPPPEPRAKRFEADDAFVRALARRLCGDAHLADDAAQETWLAALQQAEPASLFEGLGRAWLGTVARNSVLQALRGAQRRLRREQAVARGLASDDDGRAADPDLLARLRAAVRQLPDGYRVVVQQRFFEDRMPVAIADALSLPIETVRTRLRRALDRLRAAVTGAR